MTAPPREAGRSRRSPVDRGDGGEREIVAGEEVVGTAGLEEETEGLGVR